MKKVTDYVGNWGFYQSYVYVLLFLPTFLDGCHSLITAFIYAIPNTRCFIPGLDDRNNESYDLPFRLNLTDQIYTVPSQEAGKSTYCKYYQNWNVTGVKRVEIWCDHGFVYDRSQYTRTLATQLDMVCDHAWMRDVLRSLYMVGVLFGGLTLGTISDKFGRKFTLVVTGLVQLVIANCMPLCENYYLFAFLRTMMGLFGVGTFLCGFVIAMELAEGNAGVLAGIGVQVFWSVGALYIGLVAYYFRDWRWIQWACSIPMVGYIAFIWILPESLRWLVAMGKTDKAQRLMHIIVKMNRAKVSDSVIKQILEENTPSQTSVNIFQVFKYRKLLITSLAMGVSWSVTAMTYYGLALNTSDWPGDDYVNFAISSVVDIPSYILAILLFAYVGRKYSLIATYLLAGLFCILSGIMSSSAIILAFGLVGKTFISASYAMIYNYTSEIYPTVIRNAATGLCSVCGRIGGILAPEIHITAYYCGEWLPIIIYGILTLFAFAADFVLPETKDRPLPETIDDALHASSKPRWAMKLIEMIRHRKSELCSKLEEEQATDSHAEQPTAGDTSNMTEAGNKSGRNESIQP